MCIRDSAGDAAGDVQIAGELLTGHTHIAVSYTHLDVYKRQGVGRFASECACS